MPPDFGEIVERLRRSTVQVTAGRRAGGSGVIVRAEGIIATNAHVVENAMAGDAIGVQLWDGTRVPAHLLDRQLERDLALLRISSRGSPISNARLPAVTLADSDLLRAGDQVFAVGNPLGFQGALSTGTARAVGCIPALAPVLTSALGPAQAALPWVLSDIRLAPGSSGGPLADSWGRVVGINTMVVGGWGLAVPANAVTELLRGTFAPGRFGVATRPFPIAIGGKRSVGLKIVSVMPESAADRASLIPGDIMIGVDGHTLETPAAFEQALAGESPRVARLHFIRGDRARIRVTAARLGALAEAV